MDDVDFELSAETVLMGAKDHGNLKEAIVVGVDTRGEIWVSSTCKFDRLMSLLLQGQHYMIRWEEGRKQVIVEESGDE